MTFVYICLFIFLLITLLFVILHYLLSNWPMLGIFPMLLKNYDHLPDFLTEVLKCNGSTVTLKGPPFSNVKFILTSDPANVRHITTKKFSIYHKGKDWKKRFDVFGSTIFNLDFDDWKNYRGVIRGLFSHLKVQQLISNVFKDSMNKKLIPSLEHACKQEVPVDFATLIEGHIFYISCRLITGCDTISSIFPFSFHENLFPKALSDACEAILARVIFPASLWKLQKWLGIGMEKKLSDAWMTIDNVLAEQISLKKKMMSQRTEEEEIEFNALDLHLTRHNLLRTISISDSVVRDNLLSLFLAVGDTTATALTWFFWLLAKHPIVEKKVRQEIQKHLLQNGDETKWLEYGAKELNNLVYLHAALCETLRLYPPVPFELRTPIEDDVLPSGHKINRGQSILMCAYAMGRMTSIWGEDCHEFKPERWISDDGEIKHVPSHKFFAFMAGPRICPGKDIGFSLMKATASSIIHNYHIQVVESHPVTPKTSIVLHMKHGLRVTIKKRWPSP